MSSGCPHGWSYFNHRCFVYVPRSMNWGQAEVSFSDLYCLQNLIKTHLA